MKSPLASGTRPCSPATCPSRTPKSSRVCLRLACRLLGGTAVAGAVHHW